MAIILSQFDNGEVVNVKFNGKTVYRMRYDNNFVYCKPYSLTIYTDNCDDPYFLNYSSDEPTTNSDITNDYDDYEYANNATVFYGDSFSLGCASVDEGYSLPIQSFGPFDKDYDPPSNVEFSPDGTEIIIDLTATEDSGGSSGGEDSGGGENPDDTIPDGGYNASYNDVTGYPIFTKNHNGSTWYAFAIIPGGRKDFNLRITATQSTTLTISLGSYRYQGLDFASNPTGEQYEYVKLNWKTGITLQEGENIFTLYSTDYKQMIYDQNKAYSQTNSRFIVGCPCVILTDTSKISSVKITCTDDRENCEVATYNIRYDITRDGSGNVTITCLSPSVPGHVMHPWYTAGVKLTLTSQDTTGISKHTVTLQGQNSSGGNNTFHIYDGASHDDMYDSVKLSNSNDYFTDDINGIRDLILIGSYGGAVRILKMGVEYYHNTSSARGQVTGTCKFSTHT